MVREIGEMGKAAFGEYGKAAIMLLASIAVALIGWNLSKTASHDETLGHLTSESSSTHSLVENLTGEVHKLAESIEHRNELVDNKIGQIVNTQDEIKGWVEGLQAAQQQHDIDNGKLAPRRFRPD